MNKHIILDRTREYLAAELGCSPADLSGSGTLYVANACARPPYIKLAAIGERVIASASPELLPSVRELTEGHSRDELFELPLVYGQTIHFVPDEIPSLPLPDGYEYRLLEGEAIGGLRGLEGFPNSLAFDSRGHTGTGIVFFAQSRGKIAALAGAGEESEGLWEMGVDTEPSHRGRGLGAALVSRLSLELMERGRVPFYSASVTNIGSQSVAHRAGLRPLWMDTYSNTLLDSYIYKAITTN
ncbi:GNAT family N-acetyltransferase [Acutalibacter sp. 1XD8-36]|uniref:GNAT family N-acetyltransferase n=1 Tax=Acutalibacter sp. 1XD8-36 TaxID=2320852 RepID=UPI001412963B|nr:GNAT family N-acetyltransferase [Acutalibacter sp. 1XD8-36]NBJ89600.1 GNAT family N-acetyltransferase [Acutalibacter sp. 1XD8-36]